MRRCEILFLTIACALPLYAQAPTATLGALRGVVVGETGPVTGADVRLVAKVGRGLATISDDSGGFEFREVTDGEWTLVVRRIGYRPHEEPIFVRAGEAKIVYVTLKAVAQGLDTVSVVREGAAPARYGPSSRMDEFYRRRARGRGRFFTREDIEDSGRSKLTDLLRLVPGARVRTLPGDIAEVAFARCAGPVRLAQSGSIASAATGNTGGRTPSVALYMNGVRVDTSSVRRILGELSLSEVEAIEIYRGVSELPAEAIGDSCAAIFVWTRFGPG